MLRRNLLKKLFFGNALVILVPVATLHPDIGDSVFARQASFPGLSYPALFDTTKAELIDSVFAESGSPTIDLNRNVISFVNAYVKKEDEFLQKMKHKSQKYFPAIEKVFTQYELPLQLKYLAIVESELRPQANSPAGARGLWQLMPLTATELGLKITNKTDERVHTQRSTLAAAKYLKGLYTQFGDWLLVLAAYNGGPVIVYKAMKNAKSKNYWALQRYLPAESRGHVKRFIAIHYFFEGQGSVTTQTKAEATAWEQSLTSDLTPQ